MQLGRAGKREEIEFGEREGTGRRERGEEKSAGLKLTFDTQEVQDTAWISFVSL